MHPLLLFTIAIGLALLVAVLGLLLQRAMDYAEEQRASYFAHEQGWGSESVVKAQAVDMSVRLFLQIYGRFLGGIVLLAFLAIYSAKLAVAARPKISPTQSRAVSSGLPPDSERIVLRSDFDSKLIAAADSSVRRANSFAKLGRTIDNVGSIAKHVAGKGILEGMGGRSVRFYLTPSSKFINVMVDTCRSLDSIVSVTYRLPGLEPITVPENNYNYFSAYIDVDSIPKKMVVEVKFRNAETRRWTAYLKDWVRN